MISSGIRNSSSRCSSSAYVFTASQWQELEQQLLTFKYIMSGVPVPPELISTVITTPLTCSSSSLFPPLQQQSLPFGWGCFQVGYGRKIDPEPGRCRRTDGKKWRCTKEACPDSKYCERHMHRGKNKTKKPIQVFPNSTTTTPTTSATTPTTTTTNRSNTGTDQATLVSPPSNSPSTTVKNHLKPAFFTSPATSCPVPASITTTTYPQYKSQKLQSSSSFYPFLSHTDQSPSFSPDFTESTPHDSAPQWLLDPNSYVQPKKEIRYTNEMKGAVSERISAPFRDTGYDICKEEKEVVRFGFDDKDETQKQLFHHFLGD